VEQEQKPRERSFIRELVPDWHPTREQWLWAIRITVVVVLSLTVIALLGVVLWGVLDGYMDPRTATEKKDLVQSFAVVSAGVVAAVSALAAVGNLYISRRNLQQQQQQEFDRAEVERKHHREQREQEFQRAQQRRELEEERARANALPAYLDQMLELLFDKDRPLRGSKESDVVRTLARVRTLTVLARLDGGRKPTVIQFLYESKLIDRDHPVVSLNGADLSDANLGRLPDSDVKLNLSGVNLSGAQLHRASFEETILKRANLSRANLSYAYLVGADLTGANLQNTDLWDKTRLYGATLVRADLRGAELMGQDIDLTNANLEEADLRGAILGEASDPIDANLEEADLREAVHDHPTYSPTRYYAQSGKAFAISVGDLTWEPCLQGTNLKGANLHYAKLSGKRLAECKSLEGATMPNGQKYEEWLKTPKGQAWLNKYKKGRGEDRENSDPS
jgi:uncharacterized protein YjbI with pentapeptide repeats